MNIQYFHFTLGPVQNFVSQARRTRDFWAGSFLLSWLSAVAIKAVTHQDPEGNIILFPQADKNFLAYLEGNSEYGNAPQQGSIPNRFKAEIANIDNFKPEQVTKAVQEAWYELSQFIWMKDIVAPFGDDNPLLAQPGEIWDRQIPNFWDMTWVITNGIEDSSALDRRKNWRTYFTSDEPGVKCSMMNGWQELSGSERPDRAEMDEFWNTIQERGNKGIKSDLSEKESLCAIAFVKRRFSRYFIDFEHTMKQGWNLKGWDVPSGVPSVSYMAAVHWLENIINQEVDAELLTNFRKEAKKLIGEYGEWNTEIHCLKNKGDKYFKSLDGNVFYRNNLENPPRYPDKEDQAKIVLDLLNKINKTDNLDPVTPFYAVLMMDGDSLGKNMSDTTKQDVITKGLADFTSEVESIVRKNSGFLIYAGGDDVLAILPLEDAIPCATELRNHYNKCFENAGLQTSLSGAIEYVHVKTSLTKILSDAHQLLDDIAKEKTGRDSLAIRIWKPGGLQLQWSQPWNIALFDLPNGGEKSYLEELAEDFKKNDQDDEQFSSKFLYKIRERFDLLNPQNCDQDKDQTTHVFSENKQAIALMAMEYLSSGKSQLSKIKDAEERTKKAKDAIRPLLIQCRPVIREVDKNKDQWKRSPCLEADAALIVRFLAHKGVER